MAPGQIDARWCVGVGNWEHFPGELLTPMELQTRHGEPSKGGAACGTYRMRIAVLNDNECVVGFKSVDYATNVFINGEFVQGVGKPGKTRRIQSPARPCLCSLCGRLTALWKL